MIRSITSSLPSYKGMRFGPGLNIIVADKHPDATDKHTRNSAGKTSLVEVIHFLLGAEADTDSMFRNGPLAAHSFSMEFDLGGAVATVTRSGKSPNMIRVVWDPPSPWRERYRSLLPEREYTLREWAALLGDVTFGIEGGKKGDYGPTYRMLIGYFARRERDGGFLEWKRNQEEMQPWQQYVAISYLLGLDWGVAQRLKQTHAREEEVAQLKKLSKGEVLDAVIGEAGALRTQLALASERVRRIEESLATFRVHERYEELEREADEITRQVTGLSDDDLIDRQLIGDLTASLKSEAPPRVEDLERLYAEAGVVLPGVALKRYEDVRRFHDSIVFNRRRHLQREIDEAQRRLDQRRVKKQRLDTRKAEVMAVLRSHGALTQRDALQADLARSLAERDALQLRLQRAEEIAGRQSEVARQRLDLQEAWRREVQESDELIARAVVTFQRVTSMLFKEYGQFEVREDLGKNAKTMPFDVRRHGDDGKGVRNMLIFCFDMMLTIFGQENGRTPGFIVHDSHVFDGADERQVGHALLAGWKLAKEHGFQYLVTMNTDAFPVTRPDGFDLDACINPVRLTDKEDDGGLFGVRFDRPRREREPVL